MKTVRKRRQEKKTNYTKRVGLLKSGRPRAVIRRTNAQFIVQYVESSHAQDTVRFSIQAKDLLAQGWPSSAKGALKSLPAGYLSGYLFGKLIQEKKLPTPIVDFGMTRTIHGNRIFAVLKGMIDSGLDIPCPEEALPSDDRVSGEHLAQKVPVSQIKEKIEKGGVKTA